MNKEAMISEVVLHGIKNHVDRTMTVNGIVPVQSSDSSYFPAAFERLRQFFVLYAEDYVKLRKRKPRHWMSQERKDQFVAAEDARINEERNNISRFLWTSNSCYINGIIIGIPGEKKSRAEHALPSGFNYRLYISRCPVRKVRGARDNVEHVLRIKFMNKVVALWYEESRSLILTYIRYSRYWQQYHSEMIDMILDFLISSGRIQAPHLHVEPVAITIGADPEFQVMYKMENRLSVIRADEAMRFPRAHTSKIGLDGCTAVLEIRPDPSDDIDTEIENIRPLIAHCPLINSCGDVYAIGGHLHAGYGFMYTPPQSLLSLLDVFLGIPTVLLSGAARGGYAKLSAYERKQHGFEYRTPPAAIFRNPEICKLSMKIFKNVCERFSSCKSFIVPERIERVDKFHYVINDILTADEYDEFQTQLLDMVGTMNGPAMREDIRKYWVGDDINAAVERYGGQRKHNEYYGVTRPENQNPMCSRPAPAPRPPDFNEDFNEPESLEPDIFADDSYNIPEPPPYIPTVRNPRRRTSSPLVLSDDWSQQSAEYFRRELAGIANRAAQVVGVLGIRLWGLAENRGNVTYGFEIPGHTRLTDRFASAERDRRENRLLSYGLPYSIRTSDNNSSSEIITAMETAIASITAEVEVFLDSIAQGIAQAQQVAQEAAENADNKQTAWDIRPNDTSEPESFEPAVTYNEDGDQER